MLTLVVITAVFLVASGDRETHRLIKIQDGVDIVQDIVHEKDENTVTVTVSQTPALKHFVPTVNYHDFNTNYVAFKDIENGVCLLTYPPVPFATPNIYRLKRTNMTLAFKASFNEHVLTSGEVALLAGNKIGDFCHDYKTLWMDLTTQKGLNKRSFDDPEPCWAACGICFVQMDKGYQALENSAVVG